MNYYNDNDKFCCQWLRNLIEAKLIPQGVVDDRSIADIRPSELREFRQLHFFAGIGGWAYALRLAGWPDDRPVITGSCPCQPFSVAGKGGGVADPRHLWPVFRWLIAHLRPATVFGEQVASKDGRLWLAGVRADLEELGYAVGGGVISARCVGALHKRKRIYFVADANCHRCDREGVSEERGPSVLESSWCCDTSAWAALPVPSNAKDHREFLLLPDGVPNELEQIRAFGNSIVPQAAAEFVASFMEIE